MHTASDRRIHPRKKVSADVHLIVAGDGSIIEKVRMLDLSLGGMAVSLPNQPLELDQALRVCFIPNPGNCSSRHFIEARVVRKSESCIGLIFDSIGVETLHDIQKLLHDERFF